MRELEAEHARLRAVNAGQRRRLYGKKSEKLKPDQLVIPGLEEPVAMIPAPGRRRRRRRGGGRKRLPRHLPRRKIVLDVPPEERVGRVRIGHKLSEHLEYLPASYGRVLFIRLCYADPKKILPPVRAKLPPRVIPNAGVGPALLAHLIVSKYVDHQPFYRQTKIAARAGVTLRRQKLWRWCEGCAQLLLTVYRQLVAVAKTARYLQADETPVWVLDPARPGQARKAYFWVFHAPEEKAIVFEYDNSRGRDCPERFFGPDCRCILQVDGYEVYHSLARDHPGLILVCCHAHARRYVRDAFDLGDRSPEVIDTLADIRSLYTIERQAQQRRLTAEQRAQLRGERCPEIFARMKARYEHAKATWLPASAFYNAARYSLDRWAELTRYAEPGMGYVEIDNNVIERCIRPIKLGLRNFLFIGRPSAGWVSAVLYSVVESCRLTGVDPEAYLRWVLPRLAEGTNQSTATGLLPSDFARNARH